MANADSDTIAAIATAPGRGGIGVVRVSGSGAEGLARGVLGRVPVPRHATLSNFLDGDGTAIDQGVALFFPAPHSFTGEDILELQGHGGNAVMHHLLRRCLELGARLAEPGEFTRRAYLNDKLDLAQAESVADLIDAASEEAARSAMRSLRGEFSRAVDDIVRRMISLRMLVEACIDFPDEDIDFLEAAAAGEKLAQIRASLTSLLSSARQGNLLREGVQVVLIGQPNVGKSSLLNRLAGNEVAIVTPIAGTTRDTVREQIDINGVPFHIIDTAGLRDTECEVERFGIARTWAAAERAGLALLILDAQQGEGDEDRHILARLPGGIPVVKIFNKVDLVPAKPRLERDGNAFSIFLSAKTGDGISLLRQVLLDLAGWRQTGEGTFLARERHLRALEDAERHVCDAAAKGDQLEFFAEELRLAQEALGAITGAFSADDLLGEIFSRFCIGK